MVEKSEDKPGLAVRIAAARLLTAVVDKRVSLDGLTDANHGNPAFLELDDRDRALARAMLATALRYRNTIDALITARLERPLPANAHLLAHILHIACAQILFLDVPDRAAVDLAVTHASGDPRTKRFSRLVNAVLRKISGRKERALPAALAQTIDCPAWLHERLVAAYGAEKAAAIIDIHRHEAPVDLTVRDDPDHWAAILNGIVMPTGTIRLPQVAGPITSLPGFAEGAWWVQDAAAAIPARLFAGIAGKRVADLCAAPGGKTAQLALAGAEVTAIDISANRLDRLCQNLDRLGLTANPVNSDIGKFEPDRLFDAVLLDAPCSSTGTIRRHPDIPWVKTPQDIEKLANVQKRLLARAVDLTRPGGIIVFSNCSLDPLEGEQLVAEFLAATDKATLSPVDTDEVPGIAEFITAEGTVRTTPADWPAQQPGHAGLDGFFAARLRIS